MSSKVWWFDMILYRLFRWRWNPILRRNNVLREFIIAWLIGLRNKEFGKNCSVKFTFDFEEEVTNDSQ